MATNKIVINLDVPAIDFDGEPIVFKVGGKGVTWAAILRKLFLGEATSGPILKYYGWCGCIENHEPIEIDSEDYNTLYKLVEDSRQPLVIKAPIMKIMNQAKSDSEKA